MAIRCAYPFEYVVMAYVLDSAIHEPTGDRVAGLTPQRRSATRKTMSMKWNHKNSVRLPGRYNRASPDASPGIPLNDGPACSRAIERVGEEFRWCNTGYTQGW